MAIVIGSLFTK